MTCKPTKRTKHKMDCDNESLVEEKDNIRKKHRIQATAADETYDTVDNSGASVQAMQESNATENTCNVWKRPPAPVLDSEKDTLVFQQIEADDLVDHQTHHPIIRFFGVTEAGNSVLCRINGFMPYFYFEAPTRLRDEILLDDLLDKLKEIAGKTSSIQKLELVDKHSIFGYHGPKSRPFVKVTLLDMKDLNKIKPKLESGITVGDGRLTVRVDTFYESNLAYLLRFMIDCKVTGCNWIELPAGTYKMCSMASRAQIEVETTYDKFISHAPEGEWSKMAPLRILSFDIECAGRKGIFPEPDKDSVIQIANIVKVQGESDPFIRNVFTLKDCAHIVGAHIVSYEDEADMLLAWSKFFTEVDPDVVIGYNTTNFDFPYLLDRAKSLNVGDFPYLGRIRGKLTEAKTTTFSSKAYGTRESKAINLEGRLQLDMLQALQRDYKLRSYSLNSVCTEFLEEQKEDVHYSIITGLQNGTPETRRRLAIYCLKDALLPMRLMDKLMTLFNYTEMARVTGVPFNYIILRGQQIKVISQLYRRALEKGFLIPVIKTEVTEEQYEGATVIEPERGFYKDPIATLDFSSLYPSIIQAHNLCYTTLVSREECKEQGLVVDVDYILTPNNDMFITPKLRSGLLPEILADLLTARKRAKADLKKETDPFKRAVLDSRQLALKMSANSVYGFTGATIGKLPCVQISSSVTSYGRQMINVTKEFIEDKYCIKNGYDHDARVIYGDTDSVMINFGSDSLEKTMELGRDAAVVVTKEFKDPINLEFEKVYYPYLLINKKRYAGLYWTNTEKYDKLDTKGIETVRRDNCRLVSNVIQKCLNKLLIEKDVTGAQDFVKHTIADLLQNRIDLSQLVITKALSKTEYKSKQAHVELAARMKKRDAGSAPSLGDRVAYVITKGAKKAAAYERSEDPLYVLENNLPVDTNYYLENQLANPLTRIFEPILGVKQTELLLKGSHTRSVSVATPTTGFMMKFVKKSPTCIGCKKVLIKEEVKLAVCKDCESKKGELYMDQLGPLNDLEVKYSRLWTQCQRCQGSTYREVICTNNDCSIFYMRTKTKKDLDKASAQIERFSHSW
ncbi:DNA polymerase family B-domain-containing protein [Spinellus fusiger]|nr:DNA polymerase family B-domain-containing protein [Spinellus fusiger]